MIKLDISTALFLYLSINVVGVLLLWVFFGPKTKKITLGKDEDYIWQCSICAGIYVDSKSETVSKCPQCGSYNRRQS